MEYIKLLEWIGMVSGITAVALSVREKILAWPIFILCYGIYAWIGFHADAFAFMLLNLAFIPIGIYGWIEWASGRAAARDAAVRITHIPTPFLPFSGVLLLAGTVGIGWLLANHADGQLPYLEAFATTLALLAQWMLSRKYIETWKAWIVSDLAFILLWGSQQYWPTVAMFSVFICLAIWGHLQWKQSLTGRDGNNPS